MRKVKAKDFYRYQVRRVFDSTERRIIVFKEKHCDRHFDASSGQKLCEACLQVVLDRFSGKNASYWNVYRWLEELDTRDKQNTEPDYPNTSILNLPKSLQEPMCEQWKAYQQECSRLAQEREQVEMIKAAIKDLDPVMAYKVIEARNDHEYEGFELEWLDRVMNVADDDSNNVYWNVPVVRLGLSSRATKGVAMLGLSTIGDLAGCTEEDLMVAQNLGQKSVDEIKATLKMLGLSLSEEEVTA